MQHVFDIGKKGISEVNFIDLNYAAEIEHLRSSADHPRLYPHCRNEAILFSSLDTPIVFNALILPDCFTITMMLVVPERFFFLRTNIHKYT